MGIYYNLKKSLIRAIVELANTILPHSRETAFPNNAATGYVVYRTDQDKLYQKQKSGWTELDIDHFFLDIDLHAVEQAIPNRDILLSRGYSVQVDEHTVSVSVLVGVMMHEDSNAVQHDLALDKIFEYFLPTKKFPIYDMNTGNVIGEFQVKNDVEVMPIIKADQRPAQFVGIALASNLTVNLASQ